jgi:DNA-binding CsgD family transcriptional regulator
MLGGGEPGQDSGENMVSLLERSLENGFQLTESEGFSSVSDTKRQLKRRKTPDYRRINSYYKSTKQYWKERNRRKQVKELRYVHFLNQEEIAAKLGISVSTVKRDLKKVERFIRGQLNRATRLMREEWQRDYEKTIDGLSLGEQFDYLSKLMDEYKTIWRIRDYDRHVHKITIDLDYIKYDGYPRITHWPLHPTRNLVMPIILEIICVKNNRKEKMGSVTFSQVRRRSWW